MSIQYSTIRYCINDNMQGTLINFKGNILLTEVSILIPATKKSIKQHLFTFLPYKNIGDTEIN